MNRSAYLTTGLAIKALSNLSKANIVLHDKENIPEGPTIFVVNHFTRIETFLLPAHIFDITGKPVWSLAHAGLFQGGLGTFFDLVGVVSTSHPQRDELIVKSLLTGEAHWIIFPEGAMLKTKQVMERGKYMVTSAKGMHKPHTGAAALALRCELIRRFLINKGAESEEAANAMLEYLGIDELGMVREKATNIIPVNLTYYPIRAKENVLSNLATKMVKDIPERMVEEIMTEGTMLLSGVDIDIRFGEPIAIAPYLERPKVKNKLEQQDLTGFLMSPMLKDLMQELAEEVMQRYMADIYAMSTVNHEHLIASLLRQSPWKKIREQALRRKLFLVSAKIADIDKTGLYLHKSLTESQCHLLTDDRYGKFSNFKQLAIEKGVFKEEGDILHLDRSMLSTPISFHRGRIENPIEVMANETEPLSRLQRLVTSLAYQPDFVIRCQLFWYLFRGEKRRYLDDCQEFGGDIGERSGHGKPYLLPNLRRKMGVVLIHSYLSVPAEMRRLACYLRKLGVWVYALRLPGHGTTSRDLAGRNYQEWIDTVEAGYLMLRSMCDQVVLAGVCLGGSLALEVASRLDEVAGVIAVCPPFKIQDYATTFMPAPDVWKRVVQTIKRDESEEFFEFTTDNSYVHYRSNPYSGIQEVDHLLEVVARQLPELKVPSLIIQSGNDPVVHNRSARKVFAGIKEADKQFCLLSSDRHVLINGEGSGRANRLIGSFVEDLLSTTA